MFLTLDYRLFISYWKSLYAQFTTSTTVQISVGLMLGVSAHLCLYVRVMPEKNDLITLQLQPLYHKKGGTCGSIG